MRNSRIPRKKMQGQAIIYNCFNYHKRFSSSKCYAKFFATKFFAICSHGAVSGFVCKRSLWRGNKKKPKEIFPPALFHFTISYSKIQSLLQFKIMCSYARNRHFQFLLGIPQLGVYLVQSCLRFVHDAIRYLNYLLVPLFFLPSAAVVKYCLTTEISINSLSFNILAMWWLINCFEVAKSSAICCWFSQILPSLA